MNTEPGLSEQAVEALKEQWWNEGFTDKDEGLEMLARANNRLNEIFGIMGKKVQGSNIVVLGGGPGDMIWHPWFPRAAVLAGANYVVNFDPGMPSQADWEAKLYDHDFRNGDVTELLWYEFGLRDELHFKDVENVDLIEVSNLIGNSVSPKLQEILEHRGTIAHDHSNILESHPEIIKLRTQLRLAAPHILHEGGIVAIDKVLYQHQSGKMVLLPDHSNPSSGFIEDL